MRSQSRTARRMGGLAIGAAVLAALVAPPALLAQEPTSGPAVPTTEPASTVEPASPPPADAPGEPSDPVPSAPGDTDEASPPAPTPLAVAAGAGGVTMADFSFTPAAITISVGDTVTWTNSGPDEPHTATADDGSFDTGEVAVGGSASHTFTEAGTFPYTCSLHPDQMRGTVTVEAGGGAGGGGGSDGDDSSGSAPSVGSEEAAGAAPDAAGTASKLPSTGLLALPLALIGAGLLGLGLWIRRSREAA